jgi:hypothetical protein
MMCRFNNTSYSVGFLFKEHAQGIRPYISETSKVEIAEYNSHNNSILRIEKKININKLPVRVTYDEFASFLAVPFIRNTGAILIYDVVTDDVDETLFDAQILEPDYNPEAFALGLKKLI